ncbi:CHASE domain-containing protein [Neisseriaceae bacterium JH1-16]|nr:CHASE domain-containing protein [Neisseriaceae bacterium JH1-16]
MELRPLPKKWLFVLIWLSLSLLLTLIWSRLEHARLKDAFDKDTRHVYSMVSRKLDQNEAVVAAIEAQIASRQPLDIDALQRFSHELLLRYPGLYTVEFFQYVARADLDSFGATMRARYGQDFSVREEDPGRRRSWRPAGDYLDYLPVALVEPLNDNTRHLLGMDSWREPILAASIRQAITNDRTQASPPFERYPGERGYLLLRPVFASGSNTKPPPLLGVVALSVNFGRLLQPLNLDRQALGLSLFNPRQPASHPLAELFGSQADPHPQPWLKRLFGQEAVLPLQSEAQPFTLQLTRSPHWEELRWGTLLFQQLLLALLFLSMVLIYRQRSALLQSRAAADEALFEQRERALVTLQSIREGVLTLGFDRRIELANPMAVQLLKADGELVGRQFAECVHLRYELSDSLAVSVLDRCLSGGVPIELPENTQLLLPSGELRTIDGAVAPLFSRQGQISGAVVVFRDLTPMQRRARQAMEQSELRAREHIEKLAHVTRLHTMGEMASGIAHELNQPLTAIANYCQASISLLDEVDAPLAPVRSALEAAQQQARRAADILRNLRAFVSKRPVSSGLVDLNQVVANCLQLAEFDLRASDVEINLQLDSRPLPVRVDPIQLEQVMLNLLSNALDAMRENEAARRKLLIVSKQVDGEVRLQIEDSGPGVPAHMLDMLFHPFHSTKPHGMGLGLSICQTIVEQFRGQIGVENIPGGGARSWLRLRLAVEPGPIVTRRQGQEV